jgi:hypothetical protein
VLKWYADEFDRRLQSSGARLMVIGYSFSDPHINDSIIEACKVGLKVFIIDTAGPGVLDRRNKTAAILEPPTDLMNAVQPQMIGISRRPLSLICRRRLRRTWPRDAIFRLRNREQKYQKFGDRILDCIPWVRQVIQ